MGWFLVIVGSLALCGGARFKGDNAWAVIAGCGAYAICCVLVIALGVAVNQGWRP
jgi:hypothetical protein